MDTSKGDLYESRDAALTAGVAARDLVEVSGPPEAIAHLSKLARKAHREKLARQSRRKNHAR